MALHRQGGKFTGSHTTVTEFAAKIVDEASKLSGVAKISLGIIEQTKNKKRRIKCKEIPAGWEVTVYGNVTIQVIYIYVGEADRHQVRQVLEKVRL